MSVKLLYQFPSNPSILPTEHIQQHKYQKQDQITFYLRLNDQSQKLKWDLGLRLLNQLHLRQRTAAKRAHIELNIHSTNGYQQFERVLERQMQLVERSSQVTTK
ncbi:Hypothetical_protein [Hexamita inflata]|uniref:Hypothetical_protein n=1 Tax=Hexamita inflata TaxID=28002 RepID=A0ABP1HH42_9EUKA